MADYLFSREGEILEDLFDKIDGLPEPEDLRQELDSIGSDAAAGKEANDNLAGHTVATNVPEDAKFTDTVYDDTEVKEKLSEIEGKEDEWDEKLGDAPSDGKQYARKNGAWEEVHGGPGGTGNHAELENLDFENSGHTGFQAEIEDLETIRSGAAAGATAYRKPSTGIPRDDLSISIINNLNAIGNKLDKPAVTGIDGQVLTYYRLGGPKWQPIPTTTGVVKYDAAQTLTASQKERARLNIGAYTKPTDGIPSTDLASGVQTTLGKVTTIEGKIPSQASSENQLADKNFVNSSVQTASANFRGSWATKSAIPTDASQYPADYAGNRKPTTNDYLVVQADESEDGGTWRYKYSGNWDTDGVSGWNAEYEVNETPLTSAQLAALNSGVTAAKVALIDSAYQKPSTGIPASDIESGVIPDVSGFITKDVNNLTNYYDKDFIGRLFENYKAFVFVYQLPRTQDADRNKIYILITSGSHYEGYIVVSGMTSYEWAKVFESDIDLSAYSTTAEMTAAIAAAVAGKLDTPSGEGTEGQVLTLDENGEPTWQDAAGGTIDSETVTEETATPEFPFVEYAEQTLTDSQKAQARENIDAESPSFIAGGSDSAVTVAMDAGKTYKYMNSTGVSSLAFTLNTPSTEDRRHLWTLKFRSGATATNVTWPSGLYYPDGKVPTIEANAIYEISIDEDMCVLVQTYKQATT